VKGSSELLAALRRTYQAEEAKLDDLGDPPSAPTQGDGQRRDADETRGSARPSAGPSPTPDPPAAEHRERVNEGLMSTTDPDAAAVGQGRGECRFRYKNHRAVDDAHGVITATHTTSGDVAENGELPRRIDAHEQNTGKDVHTVVADTKYGTVENFRACAQRGVASHIADLAATSEGAGRREGIYPERDFTYDPVTDTYRCPAGETLRRRRHKKDRQAYDYTAGATVCQGCAQPSQRAARAGEGIWATRP
jgi:hypothetical protein